jgi:hypothetical protein
MHPTLFLTYMPCETSGYKLLKTIIMIRGMTFLALGFSASYLYVYPITVGKYECVKWIFATNHVRIHGLAFGGDYLLACLRCSTF